MSLAGERSLRGQSRRYALIMQRLDRRLGSASSIEPTV